MAFKIGRYTIQFCDITYLLLLLFGEKINKIILLGFIDGFI